MRLEIPHSPDSGRGSDADLPEELIKGNLLRSNTLNPFRVLYLVVVPYPQIDWGLFISGRLSAALPAM